MMKCDFDRCTPHTLMLRKLQYSGSQPTLKGPFLGRYITELEAKFLKVQQMQIEILKALKDTEFDLEAALMEIQTLKQYIIDLKARIAVYIPVKNDAVDRKLAEYINNFPDR